MANTHALAGARAPHRPYLKGVPRPLTWIKRRARSLERAYAIPRRIALLNARIDWAHFQPVVTL
ncbi:MAG: hypothetical protein V4858_03155 [Pseudomonadota bacterium]